MAVKDRVDCALVDVESTGGEAIRQTPGMLPRFLAK
jgi:hypothetical protein